MKWFSENQISGMSVNQLSKALSSGELSEKQLRQAYSSLRSKAMSRAKRVGSERVTSEFGNTPDAYFQTLKGLPTQSQLVRAVVDVTRFLKSKQSTITGLKSQRQNVINSAEKMGFDVDTGNYREFVEFMRWFKASEFSKLYDSDSEEVREVFNSESAGAGNWRRAFEEFTRQNGNS